MGGSRTWGTFQKRPQSCWLRSEPGGETCLGDGDGGMGGQTDLPVMMAPPWSHRLPRRALRAPAGKPCGAEPRAAALRLQGHLGRGGEAWAPPFEGPQGTGFVPEDRPLASGWGGDSEALCGLHDRRRLWGAGEWPGSEHHSLSLGQDLGAAPGRFSGTPGLVSGNSWVRTVCRGGDRDQ